MKLLTYTGLALAAAGVMQCSSSGPTERTLGHYAAEMDGIVDVSAQALAAHRDAVQREPRLQAVQELEEAHLDAMLGRMYALEDGCEAMAACGAAMHRRRGTPAFDAMPMAEASTSLRANVEAHWRHMQQAPDIEAARREEARHWQTMQRLFGRMHRYGTELMELDLAEGFTCRMDHEPGHGRARGMTHHR